MHNFRRAFLLFALLMLPASTVSAADDTGAVEINGVGMGPSIIDVTCRPGDSFEQVFNIHNKTDATVSVKPYVQDYRIEDGQWNEVGDPDPQWSPMAWTTIVNVPEKLEPGEQAGILVRFDIPENAEMGEHVTYFNVQFTPMPTQQEGEQNTQITVASQIRSIIYVKVTDPQGNINLNTSWRLDKAGVKFWNFSSPEFEIAAENTGDVHLEVRGTIEFTDVVRNQREELDISLFNVLPGDGKEITVKWEEAPFIGYFKGRIKLTYDGVNFEEREISFVTVPLLTLIGILAVVVAIVLAIVLYIRKLKKRLADMEELQNRSDQ